jgi:hypothetical protein
MPSVSLGSPQFAAAIDVIDVAHLADTIDPEPLIGAYIQSLRSGNYSLSTARLKSSGARALVEIATRTTPERRHAFLSPLDVPTFLAKGMEPDANEFIVADDLGRALRAHIRVLCRAVAAWEATPPPDVVDALVKTVRVGALSHAEKGRVAAFSARYEGGQYGGYDDRPMAADLGEALVALGAEQREQLLGAILETDEPLTLAQLVGLAPHSVRARIRDRISVLTPEDSGEVSSLPEVQARIEELLSAGALDAAAKFIDVERDLKTLGQVPGRVLTRFRVELRLHLLRGEFTAIASAGTPAELGAGELAEAKEVLDFYQALSELSKANGDLHAAETVFERLRSRRSDIVAYGVNLLAARASGILVGDLFGRVGGDQSTRARQALSDAEEDMSRWRGVRDNDLAIHACNRALLLLATGQPERALTMLEGAQSTRLEDRIAAYSAVALSRMGRGTDANDALERAEKLFGETELLRAARAQIQRGTALAGRALATSADDSTTRIKAALYDLWQMDPSRQSAVLWEGPGALDAMVISYVRAAAASVVALVPMMKDVVLDSCEDDLTALVEAILTARLDFVGWSVADQSKGGFTGRGNPGERDLVLRKDGAILAVLEAVVCNRPATHEWTKKELASHFQKLLGYSTCRLFFHITYSYVEDPGMVLVELRRVAESEAPTGFAYVRCEELPLTDSRPTGCVATYQSGLGEVKVVFLLLNMAQHAQRDAAKVAAANNPRKTKDVG